MPAKKTDKRSESITADEDMHIVAIEHFIGVSKGGLSDNGHILSKSPDNPWVKWEESCPTGMEPTGGEGVACLPYLHQHSLTISNICFLLNSAFASLLINPYYMVGVGS